MATHPLNTNSFLPLFCGQFLAVVYDDGVGEQGAEVCVCHFESEDVGLPRSALGAGILVYRHML